MVRAFLMYAFMGCLSAQEAPPNEILAYIGHTTITRQQLLDGIPNDLFGLAAQQAKEFRFNNLVTAISEQQCLLLLGTTVDDTILEKSFLDSISKPPPALCSCCMFGSFDEYLKQTYSTRADVRMALWIELAKKNYSTQQWEVRYSEKAGKDPIMAQERTSLRQQYIHTRCIIIPPHDGELGSALTRHGASWIVANALCQRLGKGESWEAMVQAMIDDPSDRDSALATHITTIDECHYVGLKKELVLSQSHGYTVEPHNVFERWMVAMWEPLSDDEVLHFIQTRFDATIKTELAEAITRHITVRYAGEGIQLADGWAKSE